MSCDIVSRAAAVEHSSSVSRFINMEIDYVSKASYDLKIYDVYMRATF